VKNKVYSGYFGGKNGAGVYQQIINQIRPHDVYLELFAGSGAIVQYKKPALLKTIIADIDERVYNDWISSTIDIPNCEVLHICAIEFLSKYCFNPKQRYCIYLDPPYPLSSRRSDREVYRHEMTDQQHYDLLAVVKTLPANVDVIISTYWNEIYENELSGWRVHTFKAQTRKGPAVEYLYMNYMNTECILHQYDYLGTDYIDRQRIKRKIEREIQKLINLPAAERNAIVTAVLDLA
jgi:site-specific DNA-adenine methylase